MVATLARRWSEHRALDATRVLSLPWSVEVRLARTLPVLMQHPELLGQHTRDRGFGQVVDREPDDFAGLIADEDRIDIAHLVAYEEEFVDASVVGWLVQPRFFETKDRSVTFRSSVTQEVRALACHAVSPNRLTQQER